MNTSRSTTQFKRFLSALLLAAVIIIGALSAEQSQRQDSLATEDITTEINPSSRAPATKTLQSLEIKGRAPKTGYNRALFSSGWGKAASCDMRNIILQRDLEAETIGPDGCIVLTGTLLDPYTNKVIQFTRGATTSSKVQIDHVVAVSDAWQKGAQQLSPEQRYAFYNDPLNLLAVDGPANQIKGDGDAATWLPPNKAYRCEYVARQIAVKHRYQLWVTPAEFKAIDTVLTKCPEQTLPSQ